MNQNIRQTHLKSKKKILIHVDHRRRDIYPSILLSLYLKNYGYKCILGSRVNSKYLYYKHRPDLVLLTQPNCIFNANELKNESKNTIFVLMHPESSEMNPEMMINMMRGGEKEVGNRYTKYISKVFTWGPILKNVIVNEGLFEDEQVEIVGNFRYDFYLNKKKSIGNEIGAMSSFTGISNFDNRAMFSNIDNGRNLHGYYYDIKGGYEDYLWMSSAFLRIYYEFMDVWCLENKNKISLRPYTLESLADYSYFRKKYGEFIDIDSKTPFFDWINGLEANVFCYSSSIIESVVSNTPFITIQGIIEERLEFHFPKKSFPAIRGEIYEYTHKPKSIDELIDLLNLAKNNKLKLKTDIHRSKNLSTLLWDYYGWPQKKPSSEIIAQEIHNLIGSHSINKEIKFKKLMKEFAIYPLRSIKHMHSMGLKSFNDYNYIFLKNNENLIAKTQFQNITNK